MNRPIFYLLATYFSLTSLFAEPYTYTITEHPYHFSTYFEMQGKNGFEGRAVKGIGISMALLERIHREKRYALIKREEKERDPFPREGIARAPCLR